MNDHLDPEVLAEHAEALLSPGDAANADRHLAGCAQCQRTYDDLAVLSTLLAGDGPGPMPADVAASIDAALVRERAGAATLDLGAARRARSRRWLQVGSVAAGLALVAAGAALGSQLVGGPGDRQAVTESAGGAAREAAPKAAASGPPVTATGRTYTAAGLADEIRPLIGPPALSAAGSGADEEYPARDAAPSGLARCVEALGAGAATPLAADTGRWDGRTALVVVLPGADPKQLSVYVVEPSCTAGKAEVLHHAEVPRPAG